MPHAALLGLIIILPIMPAVMSTVMPTVIVTTIVGGAIVNASTVVIISVPWIAVAAVVIAVPVRCTTESDAEALCLRLVWAHSQQSENRQYKEGVFFIAVQLSALKTEALPFLFDLS